MPWGEPFRPVRMSRVALVASRARLRETLVELAGAGLLDIDRARADEPRYAREAVARAPSVRPSVLASQARVDDLRRAERWDLVAGEHELERVAGEAIQHRGAAVLVGWTPEAWVGPLRDRMGPVGGSVVELPHPARAEAPTLLVGPRLGSSLRPLVDTYGTVPYADVDPAMFAGLSYITMFGIMFGDIGHGLILAGLGLYLRRSGRPALASLRRVWGVVVAAGLASAVCGALYGEVFGPTGVVPALWLAPMREPIVLLLAGVIVGAALLGISYVIGMINRWREGGLRALVYAASGIAGASLYLGGAAVAAGFAFGAAPIEAAGFGVACLGLVLLFGGFLAGSEGGLAGLTQAVVETIDSVIRTGSNAISFSRLAAFGLTHAAVGAIVWSAATTLSGSGPLGLVLAGLVFIVGNVLAFGLEALVAALQALRLEYYELFSRIFSGEGRVFAPWRLSVMTEEEA